MRIRIITIHNIPNFGSVFQSYALCKYLISQGYEDTKIILRDVIDKLPEESQYLVKLYYYGDLNQKEIADKLGLTQMQVSRKLKKAFSLLYKMIADNTAEV